MLAHHIADTTLVELLAEACGADIDLRIATEEWLRPWVPDFSVMAWSEQVGRTKAEVLALLATAALRAGGLEVAGEPVLDAATLELVEQLKAREVPP